MERLINISNYHGTKLVIDMVYDDFIGHNDTLINPLNLIKSWKNIFVVNSMSKNYGAPGLRIGWIVSSDKNINQLSSILEKQMIAISGPSQAIALNFLQHGNDELKTTIAARIAFVNQIKCQYDDLNFNSPTSGIQFIAEVPINNIREFTDYMLIKHKILLATSDNYAGTDKKFVRIPASYHPNDIKKSLTTLTNGLLSWQQDSHTFSSAEYAVD